MYVCVYACLTACKYWSRFHCPRRPTDRPPLPPGPPGIHALAAAWGLVSLALPPCAPPTAPRCPPGHLEHELWLQPGYWFRQRCPPAPHRAPTAAPGPPGIRALAAAWVLVSLALPPGALPTAPRCPPGHLEHVLWLQPGHWFRQRCPPAPHRAPTAAPRATLA